MNIGFCRIISVCNVMPNTAVRYFGLCHVLSPSMFRVGCIFTFIRILSAYLGSCVEIM